MGSEAGASARTPSVELRALGREEEWEYSSQSLEKEEKRRRIEKEKEEKKIKRISRFAAPDERRRLRGSLCRKNLYRASRSQSTSGRKNRTCYKFSGPEKFSLSR